MASLRSLKEALSLAPDQEELKAISCEISLHLTGRSSDILGPRFARANRMWDFILGRAISVVLRTLPFVLLRMAVYFGIGFAYLLTIGVGAVIGFGFGHLGGNPDAPVGGAFWGGLIGFGITSAVLYFLREYILYLVKAAHIACLVELLDGRSIPAGQSQVAYGAKFVETHFTEASVLFGVDQIIKAVLRSLFRVINFFSAFLPIPGLQQLVRIAEAIIRL